MLLEDLKCLSHGEAGDIGDQSSHLAVSCSSCAMNVVVVLLCGAYAFTVLK